MEHEIYATTLVLDFNLKKAMLHWGNRQANNIKLPYKTHLKTNFKNLELSLNESWNKHMLLVHNSGPRYNYHQAHYP